MKKFLAVLLMLAMLLCGAAFEIGRASCRERV